MHQFLVTDPHLGELPETGIHAVDRVAAGHDIVDQLGRLADSTARIVAQLYRQRLLPGRPKFGQPDKLVANYEFHDSASLCNIGSCKPCSFAHATASS